VTRFSLWLAAITTSFSLAAGEPQQEKLWSNFAPIELQLGGSIMGYGSHEGSTAVTGGTTADFAPKGSGFAPSIRFSVDVYPIPIGTLQVTGGYRLGNSISLDVSHAGGTYSSDSNLKHQAQLQVGGNVRVDYFKKYEFGLGFEARNDWMKAAGRTGFTNSESSVWRTWLRANARYMFERDSLPFVPYAGIECGFALAKPKIEPSNYFLDYVNNTGDATIDPLYSNAQLSPDSYTKVHAPNWEVAIVVGIRFGRNCP
jgi:hypothetical protein